jgi:AraC-like DNA-binding protein
MQDESHRHQRAIAAFVQRHVPAYAADLQTIAHGAPFTVTEDPRKTLDNLEEIRAIHGANFVIEVPDLRSIIADKVPSFSFSMSYSLVRWSVNFVGTTHPFTAIFTRLGDIIGIALPWSGQFVTAYRNGDERVASADGVAHFVPQLDGMRTTSPLAGLTMILRIPLGLALAALGELGGVDVRRFIFEKVISVSPEVAGRFRRAALFAAMELSHAPPPATRQMITRNLDDVLSMILFELLSGERQHSVSIMPAQIRRAEEFMRTHAAQSISLVEIAAAAATSPRNLQVLFKKFRGMTPLSRLREIRLDGARIELEANPRQSVAQIAQAWGFGHIGRFSIDFCSRFGKPPREWARQSA